MNMTTPGDSLPTVATWLGRAGLLPFVAAPFVMALLPQQAQRAAHVLALYALSIICFLVGVWWGLALIRRVALALVLSNAVVLIAFFGYLGLPDRGFLLLCSVLFPATVVLERSHQMFRPQPPYYARLRLQLTTIATLSLLLAATQM
jgi:hypothetical protein